LALGALAALAQTLKSAAQILFFQPLHLQVVVMAEHQTVALIETAQLEVLVAEAREMALARREAQETLPLHLHRKVALVVTELKQLLHTQRVVAVAHLLWAVMGNQTRLEMAARVQHLPSQAHL
jgi:hypothetical protein